MDHNEKMNMDDSTTETLKSASPSMSEKASAVEADRQGSISPQPNEHPELKRVQSTREAREQLTKIMTSGEGVEYPTGVRLGLISLALCLSVFLMALVSGRPFHNKWQYSN